MPRSNKYCTGKGRNHHHQREGEAVVGAHKHEDAELHYNPPIHRIKVYLYMILLFIASGSLKYTLSGNKKIPYSFFYIRPIYRRGKRSIRYIIVYQNVGGKKN
jgi:hypothetical protein